MKNHDNYFETELRDTNNFFYWSNSGREGGKTPELLRMYFFFLHNCLKRLPEPYETPYLPYLTLKRYLMPCTLLPYFNTIIMACTL